MHPWWPGCRAQQFFLAVRFAVPGGDFTVAMGADKKTNHFSPKRITATREGLLEYFQEASLATLYKKKTTTWS